MLVLLQYYGADGGKTCCETLAVPAVTKCGGSTLPEHFMNRLLVLQAGHRHRSILSDI